MKSHQAPRRQSHASIDWWRSEQNLNLIWPNPALIGATETHKINYWIASVAKMIPALLQLPVISVVKAATFSKSLSLVENTVSPFTKATHKFSLNKFTGGGEKEADADTEMLTGRKTRSWAPQCPDVNH